MKVVKKTGLVPVHTSQDKKVVFGLPPGEAIKGVAAGTLYLVPIPEDVETFDIDDGPKEEAVVSAVPDGDGLVDIPDDWEKLHYTKIVVIAKQILDVEDLPEDGDKTVAVIAKEIVAAELEKRAAEADGQNSED